MTTFLYLRRSSLKKSEPNSRFINLESKEGVDNLEMALIKENSKNVALTVMRPIVSKNSLEKLRIEDIPFLIPTAESLDMFFSWDIDNGSYIEEGGTVYTDTAKENLLGYIVAIVQKNIAFLLERMNLSLHDETLAPNGVLC